MASLAWWEWGSLGLVSGFALWALAPTSMFLSHKSVSYNGLAATSVRETPFGGQWASWRTDCRVVDGEDYPVANGFQFYQHVDDNIARYTVTGSVADCLLSGGTKIVTHRWQVHLWGWLPLRPDTLSYAVGYTTPQTPLRE